MYNKYVYDFKKFVDEENIYENELMKNHTSFKIGGPADIFITPQKKEEIINSIKLCKEKNIPYYIMGNGSNLLVRDNGYRGVIIQIYKKINDISVKGDIIYAESGALLSSISKIALKNSLRGFEFAGGIPGTLGGAVYMNAGAYGGEMKNVIIDAQCIDSYGNNLILSNEELGLAYRSSVIQKNNYIVISANIKLSYGDYYEINSCMNNLLCKRKEKQPIELPSAGSTFKRPEGYYAGKLIMDSGLKGYSIGGACVSNKHCGFVVNNNNATAKDVIDLINHIKKTIKEKYNVDIKEEVRIIGED